MERNQAKNLDDVRSFQLVDNQVLVFEVSTLQIDCLQGVIWVTWPDGNERILQKGQTMTVVSKGVICMQGFAASTIITRRVESRTPSLIFGYRRCKA